MIEVLIGAALSLVVGFLLGRYQERRSAKTRRHEQREESLRSLRVGLVILLRELNAFDEAVRADPSGARPGGYYGRIQPAWEPIQELWEQRFSLDVRDQVLIRLYRALETTMVKGIPLLEGRPYADADVLAFLRDGIITADALKQRIDGLFR